MRNENRINRWYFGGVSSACAACVTHPLDLIKVQLQTQQLPKKNIFQIVGHIYKTGGVQNLYRGLTASLLRQLTYTTTRFGIYESGKQRIDIHSVSQTVCLATLAGVCGGIIGVPSDMINVRMQNDSKLPKEKQRRYKHVFNGLYRVFNEEGIKALFRGGTAAVVRGVVMTISQNVTYDYIKRYLISTTFFRDNSVTHFLSSLLSGGIATVCTQPLDVMKTRLMNAKPGQYSGMFSVGKEISYLGPTGFFKGLIPSFVRIGPQVVLTFLMMEQLRLHFGYLPENFS